MRQVAVAAVWVALARHSRPRMVPGARVSSLNASVVVRRPAAGRSPNDLVYPAPAILVRILASTPHPRAPKSCEVWRIYSPCEGVSACCLLCQRGALTWDHRPWSSQRVLACFTWQCDNVVTTSANREQAKSRDKSVCRLVARAVHRHYLQPLDYELAGRGLSRCDRSHICRLIAILPSRLVHPVALVRIVFTAFCGQIRGQFTEN